MTGCFLEVCHDIFYTFIHLKKLRLFSHVYILVVGHRSNQTNCRYIITINSNTNQILKINISIMSVLYVDWSGKPEIFRRTQTHHSSPVRQRLVPAPFQMVKLQIVGLWCIPPQNFTPVSTTFYHMFTKFCIVTFLPLLYTQTFCEATVKSYFRF